MPHPSQPNQRLKRRGEYLMAQKRRVPIPDVVAAEVLFSADRTCCVCRTPGKKLQIHHIDDDPSNNDSANLAVLCLECHGDTQLMGGFGRHLNAEQVRLYCDDWNRIVAAKRNQTDREAADTSKVASIHEALALKQLVISRHVPDVSKPTEYSLLTFHLTFKNEATVPIKYSMQAVSFLIDGTETEHGNLNHAQHRIGAGDSVVYNCTLDLNSPRSDIVKGLLKYRLWYGPSAEPDLYEQERPITYSNQLTLNPSVTRTDFWAEPGGHDELRVAVGGN